MILREIEMRLFVMVLFAVKSGLQHRGSTLDLSTRGLCSGPFTSEIFTYHKDTKRTFLKLLVDTLVTDLVLRAGTA